METTNFNSRQTIINIWQDIKDLMKFSTWKSLFAGRDSIFESGERYPLLSRRYESSIRNLFIIGNLSGEPDIKAALNQGHLTANFLIQKRIKVKYQEEEVWPVLIIGGGPAGVAAALEFEKLGVEYILLEKQGLFTTIKKLEKNLPLYYAKTGFRKVLSDLSFHDSSSDEILKKWEAWVKDHPIQAKIGEQVKDILKRDGNFLVNTVGGQSYQAQHVILAMGKLILLERLQVAGQKGCALRYERRFTWRTWTWFIFWISFIASFYTLKKVHPEIGRFNLGYFYPWLYTAIVLIFGIRAIFRYRDRLQTKKYLSLMFFQTAFFCVIPEIILHNWQAYSFLYAWPLGLSPVTVQAFLQSPTRFYFWWAVVMSFVLLPIFVMFAGKQYCSWICGCGGLAETFGDRWRHYRPGGAANRNRERQIFYVLAFAVLATVWALFKIPGENLIKTLYGWTVDFALIAVIPVSLYPFLGGKIWCRFWCPTAGFMHLISAWFTKKGWSRYSITSRKERCIACNLCARHCEIGIDVRKLALKGEAVTNLNSSCIGCGVCVSVCPTGVLRLNSLKRF